MVRCRTRATSRPRSGKVHPYPGAYHKPPPASIYSKSSLILVAHLRKTGSRFRSDNGMHPSRIIMLFEVCIWLLVACLPRGGLQDARLIRPLSWTFVSLRFFPRWIFEYAYSGIPQIKMSGGCLAHSHFEALVPAAISARRILSCRQIATAVAGKVVQRVPNCINVDLQANVRNCTTIVGF